MGTGVCEKRNCNGWCPGPSGIVGFLPPRVYRSKPESQQEKGLLWRNIVGPRLPTLCGFSKRGGALELQLDFRTISRSTETPIAAADETDRCNHVELRDGRPRCVSAIGLLRGRHRARLRSRNRVLGNRVLRNRRIADAATVMMMVSAYLREASLDVGLE